MDLQYMRTKNGFTNDSEFVGSDFARKNPSVAIPYLVLVSVSTVSGCMGNTMVIGAVYKYKVSELFVHHNDWVSCGESDQNDILSLVKNFQSDTQ